MKREGECGGRNVRAHARKWAFREEGLLDDRAAAGTRSEDRVNTEGQCEGRTHELAPLGPVRPHVFRGNLCPPAIWLDVIACFCVRGPFAGHGGTARFV